MCTVHRSTWRHRRTPPLGTERPEHPAIGLAIRVKNCDALRIFSGSDNPPCRKSHVFLKPWIAIGLRYFWIPTHADLVLQGNEDWRMYNVWQHSCLVISYRYCTTKEILDDQPHWLAPPCATHSIFGQHLWFWQALSSHASSQRNRFFFHMATAYVNCGHPFSGSQTDFR